MLGNPPHLFHHILKGIHNGAKLYAIDPRRTSSARWADSWLGLDVGTDIVVSNALGREIIASGLHNLDFIQHATQGFEAYAKSVESFTLDFAERESGVPKATIREMAHTYAKAGRAIICWTLGITEHHNAADNVQSLINLALLTGHIGKYGSGLNPLRGQNNVQGGGDMGALPDRLPGFQHIEVDAFREKFNRKWNTTIPPKRGWNLTEMFHAMEKGSLKALYVIGENPLQSKPIANTPKKSSVAWIFSWFKTCSSPPPGNWRMSSFPRPRVGVNPKERLPTAKGVFKWFAKPWYLPRVPKMTWKFFMKSLVALVTIGAHPIPRTFGMN